jgi:hypothetical protein
VPIFEKHVREKVSDLLVELDNWLSPYSSDAAQGKDFERVGLAVFQFVDPVVDKTPLSDKVADEARDREPSR